MSVVALVCPYCAAPLEAPETTTWFRCGRCGRLANMDAQRAFIRAKAYLSEVEGYVFAPSTSKRPMRAPSAEEFVALESYQRAHSALELAFAADLPEEARHEGIAMMAEVTQILAARDMLATVEASYWVKLLIEQNGLEEQAEIEAWLSSGTRAAFFRQLRWRLRRRGLRGALRKVALQIAELEQTIQFVDPPHVRPPAAEEGM